jgi:broad specificity phosphatase PhoE
MAPWYVSPIAGALGRALLTDDRDVGTLLLIRHGQQLPLADRSPSERRDPPLSELGRRQAEALRAHLATEALAAVYSSPMARARQTAAPIAATHGLEVVTTDGLHEIEIMREVRPDDDVTEVYTEAELTEAAERFVASRRWDALPGGETGDELRRRVVPAVEAILERHAGETVAVVCHGGVINAYLADLLGIAEDMWYRPAHASAHRLWFAEGRRVVYRLNEIEHLAAGEGSLLST